MWREIRRPRLLFRRRKTPPCSRLRLSPLCDNGMMMTLCSLGGEMVAAKNMDCLETLLPFTKSLIGQNF